VFTDGAVHVWRVDLDTVDAGLEELLSPAECERAARMLSERDRQLWARARGLLRALLGRYLPADPASFRLAIGAQGKPALAELAPTRLSFNLSHSGQLALYAFAEDSAVGVDVEVDRRAIDEPAIAARALGAAEAQRLQSLDPPARRHEFLRAWTRHEATLKCHGTGIGASSSNAHAHPLWIAELELGTHAAGAVAVDGRVRELCCWDWR
jgi:4'-phosphopantetheinyl transferase